MVNHSRAAQNMSDANPDRSRAPRREPREKLSSAAARNRSRSDCLFRNRARSVRAFDSRWMLRRRGMTDHPEFADAEGALGFLRISRGHRATSRYYDPEVRRELHVADPPKAGQE
jgi:hypothetical protein